MMNSRVMKGKEEGNKGEKKRGKRIRRVERGRKEGGR